MIDLWPKDIGCVEMSYRVYFIDEKILKTKKKGVCIIEALATSKHPIVAIKSFFNLFCMALNLMVIWIVPASALDIYTEAEESLLNRETITGDWNGIRNQLKEKGILFDLEFTEYYQGMISGDGYDGFDFGSRADALIKFDADRLGFWDGGGFHTHLTYRFGKLPAFRGGALWPVSTGSILPLGNEDNLVASSLYMSQRLGDSFSFLLGKINAVDLLANDPFHGGWGNRRFMNLALVAPPSGVLPPVIMGLISNYQIAPLTMTFMVYDPLDRTSDYWPDDLFSDGVNLSIGAKWTGKVWKRPSSISLTGRYSTEESIDLSELVLPPDLRTGAKDGAYNISLDFSHLLLESSTHMGEGLGIYGKAAIADGNPNPIEATFICGVAGHKIVSGRPNDTFGIGYFYYVFSSDLKSAVTPLIKFRDEQGVEIFYSFAITPWFLVSADIQWIDPSIEASERAWIGALRANVRF